MHLYNIAWRAKDGRNMGIVKGVETNAPIPNLHTAQQVLDQIGRDGMAAIPRGAVATEYADLNAAAASHARAEVHLNRMRGKR